MKLKYYSLVCVCGLVVLASIGTVAAPPGLSELQFKAVHNAYQTWYSPRGEIDSFNVWEIELDFGVQNPEQDFIVGHNGPEPNFGLYFLHEWIANAKSSVGSQFRPTILKLEAKTENSCGWDPGCDWYWLDGDEWGEWQQRLREGLNDWLGADNWITRQEFEDDYYSQWPSVQELRGKWIVFLLDNNDGNDIDMNDRSFFFTSGQAGLLSGSAPDATEFGRAIKDAKNRLTMDNEIVAWFSNVFVHPPQPTHVGAAGAWGWQWGTLLEPFTTIGHAVNSYYTFLGAESDGEIQIAAGHYAEKMKVTAPVILKAFGGGVTIGGASVCYTVSVSVMDVEDAGTSDGLYAVLHGTNGSTQEIHLTNPAVFLWQAGIDTFWFDWSEIGEPTSIRLRVNGDDDLAVDAVHVVSATHGRYRTTSGGWVGEDNTNPRTFELSK